MDAKNKICLMLVTFFVLLLLFLCVLKAQADWFNDYGPVPPVPDPGDPVPADDSNGNNTPYPPPFPPVPSPVIKEAFDLAVGAITGDLTSDCLGKTVNEASLKLGGLFISSYLKGNLNHLFRLTVPNLYPQYQILQLLISIEIESINRVQAQIVSDLRKIRAFYWPTEAEKERALLMIQKDEDTINKWKREAREEANKGINWSHNWNDNENSNHDFHPGPAYEQLKTISSLGWLNR